MAKPFTITLPEWVEADMIGETVNKSSRIRDLIIKGYLYEKERQVEQSNNANQPNEKAKSGPGGI